MADSLTRQIIEALNFLPNEKKRALLELIKTDHSISKNQNKNSKEDWRKKLLNTSVWSDSEVEEIYKAREYINKWQTKQFF